MRESMGFEMLKIVALFLINILVLPVVVDKAAAAVNLKVGVVLDLNDVVGKMGLSCIKMAISDFYANRSYYKTRLILNPMDSNGTIVGAATAAMELIQNSKVEAILGPESSSQAYFIVQLGDKAEVPIISFAPTISTLSYLKSPYFFQVAQNRSSQVYAISDILKAFGWRQTVAIYEDNEFGKWIVADLIDALQDIKGRVHRSIIDTTASSNQIKEELKRLGMMQTRVFVVHVEQSLGTRVFAIANELGMMSEGYVWILTDATANMLNTFNTSTLSSMQGVLGVKTYIPKTETLNNFTSRWRRKFRQDNPSIDDPQVNVYGLWAYDAAWALAIAVERIERATPNSTQNGKKISQSLLKTKFSGLSGEFSLVKGQLESQNLEIVNVMGERGERTVGYWTPKTGLFRMEGKGHLRSIIWPGDSVKVPKGWGRPLNNGENKLRIGVGLNVGFSEFSGVINNGSVVGFCIDVFEAVVAELPFALSYSLIPFTHTYDDLIMQLHEGKFDAAIGDITILANRSSLVDFTLPFTEAGISLVVPVRRDMSLENRWVFFIRPFSWNLWLAILGFFLFMSTVVWTLEHRDNEHFHGSASTQFYTSFWISFRITFFAQVETLKSSQAKTVVAIWLLVAFVLIQSYTANLASWLTVQQLQPITDINQIIKNGWNVGYQNGSYVFHRLEFLGIKNVVPYASLEQLHELFQKGSRDGGIDAAIDEIPYVKLLLLTYPDNYTMGNYQYNSGGFGFAFQTGSYLIEDMSKAVLHVTQSDKRMRQIQERWFGKKLSHQRCCGSSKGSPISLDLSYFWSLFFLACSTALFSILTYIIYFFIEKRHELLLEYDRLTSFSLWGKIIATLRIFIRTDR